MPPSVFHIILFLVLYSITSVSSYQTLKFVSSRWASSYSSSSFVNTHKITTSSMSSQDTTYDSEKWIIEESHQPLSKDILDSILKVAIDASLAAGRIIADSLSTSTQVIERKANNRDLLTLIDPQCETTIRDIVYKSFPLHDFLGEEDVSPGKEASAAALDSKLKQDGEFLWIVDPIDGTSNFVHGMPLCMPSVACAYKGEVIVGVIYDPHRNELFTAVKGHGAFLNGKLITVGEQQDIGDAIVAMGSPPGLESLSMSLLGVKALMPKVRTIRMLGSAALMLAWVANGRLTCYWEYDLSSWDIAAGALLILEAGGKFTDLENNHFNLRSRKICASNGKVHDDVLLVLNQAGIH